MCTLTNLYTLLTFKGIVFEAIQTVERKQPDKDT